MNIRHNERLRERLAAEFVLGTLRGGARRRFEAWLRDDGALRRAVAEWQDRLHPMAELAPSVTPPVRVWNSIERLIANGQPKTAAWWQSLASNLTFWRGLAFASTAVATVLTALLLTQHGADIAPRHNYIAALADERGQIQIMVKGEPVSRELVVTVVAPQNVSADKSLELWALPKDGPPRSLGLIATNGSVRLPLPENATPESVPALAISLEPKGGSPNPNAPSGPVLFKGVWVQT